MDDLLKVYRFIADGIFFAENIDDANLKLSKHFEAVSKGEDSDLFDAPAHIKVYKVKPERKANGET